MAKNKDRREHTRYADGGSHAAAAIFKKRKGEIADLLLWLEPLLMDSEVISIHCWTEDWLYVVVEDTRPCFTGVYSVAGSRLGFTVIIHPERIMWNDDCSANHHGGNCFVRTAHWKRRLLKEYCSEPGDGVHFYRNDYGAKND